MPTDLLSVLVEFRERNIRYVLAGGLAVLLHGIDRLTAGIDLVVDLAPEVDARQFADAAVRERWRRESGMVVLSFWDPRNRRPTVDLFANYPMEFELLFRDSLLLPLATTTVRVASLDHLISIKRAAGRPKDLDDADRLAELRDRK